MAQYLGTDQLDVIEAMLKEKKTFREIASVLDTSVSSVINWKKHGEKNGYIFSPIIKGKRFKVTKEELILVDSLLKENKNVEKIYPLCGLKFSALQKWCSLIRKLGIETTLKLLE